MTLTQLGQIFGASSHEIGRWLVDIGLRNEQKRPSKLAFDGDFCRTGPSRGAGYNWVWHTQKTVEALKQAGHKMVSPPPLDLVHPARISGPFTTEARDGGKIEIVNGDGTASLWAIGESNAKIVARLLNLAHQHGVLDRVLLVNKTEQVNS
jgi:hypothetical protein